MKDKNVNRSKWLTIRLSEEEEKRLTNLYNRTTSKSISEYARDVLLKKQITVIYRNRSADDFLSQIISLKKELNAIGNNFNQAVKKLHTLQQIAEFKSWIITYELEKQTLFNKVDEIKNRINKIADKWLQ